MFSPRKLANLMHCSTFEFGFPPSSTLTYLYTPFSLHYNVHSQLQCSVIEFMNINSHIPTHASLCEKYFMLVHRPHLTSYTYSKISRILLLLYIHTYIHTYIYAYMHRFTHAWYSQYSRIRNGPKNIVVSNIIKPFVIFGKIKIKIKPFVLQSKYIKSYLFILLKINKVNSLKKEQLFIKI